MALALSAACTQLQSSSSDAGDASVNGDPHADSGASGKSATSGASGTRSSATTSSAEPVSGSGDEAGAGGDPAGGDAGRMRPDRCGNAHIDPGETCDPPSSCPAPSSCASNDVCFEATFEGAAGTCDAQCRMVERSDCSDGDGCCPSSCNATTDTDCAPSCGNGVVESGELCDGDCPNSQVDCAGDDPCQVPELLGSDCTRKCRRTPIVESSLAPDGCCPGDSNANIDADCSPTCGNRVLEAGEQCDGGQACGDDCHFQDLASTPGDDRPGYVSCGTAACGPSERCCGSTALACIAASGTCGSFIHECDGPEDCPSGEACWIDNTAICDTVRDGASLGCHTASDCPGFAPNCVAGRCAL